MLAPLLRPLFFLCTVVAAWFVSSGAPNFSVITTAVGIFFITLFVALAAFGESLVERFQQKRARPIQRNR